MRGLAETIAELSQRGKTRTRPSRGGEVAGLIEVKGFGFNPGALKMLSYAPQRLAPGAALVVVLHGCTQQATAYACDAGWITLAERFGFALLAPEQSSANNPNRCFNWFEPGDITRGSGEAASIQSMVKHMVRAHDLDCDRVFVTGLSAGGAMTAVMLSVYPETFAAGAVVAGLAFGMANNVQEAFAAMQGRRAGSALGSLVDRAAPTPRRKPRLAIWHGQADGTVASSNAEALALQWTQYHQLSQQPGEVHTRGGWSRSVWRAEDGQAIVEMNLLSGLGHGTPLAAGGDDPIGKVAPFMLEAGVSSSLEIARFWGLAPSEPASQSELWREAGEGPAQAPPSGGLGQSVMASVAAHVPASIQRVISTALTSAGLMR